MVLCKQHTLAGAQCLQGRAVAKVVLATLDDQLQLASQGLAGLLLLMPINNTEWEWEGEHLAPTAAATTMLLGDDGTPT